MTAPGAAPEGCAEGGRAWHAGMGIMVLFTLMWITGAVLLPTGLSKKSVVEAFDPATDFTVVLGGCQIDSVMHVAEQRQDRSPYCVDVYRYSFTIGISGTLYQSALHEQRRQRHSSGTNCADVMQLPALYSVGETIVCWEPASGKSKSDVDSLYKCGNSACVKALDPAVEYADALGSATLFITLGSIFLGVGLSACGIVGAAVKRCPSEAVHKAAAVARWSTSS